MNLLIQKRVQEVFERTYLMTLATCDADGAWAADVIFVTDDQHCVYWMSKRERRHSKAITLDPRVAVTMSVTSRPEDPDLGVQISGRAEVIEEIDFEIVKKYFRKRHKPEPLPTDDVLGEHVWYRLTPDRVELIDGEHFGYDRQSLALSTENH